MSPITPALSPSRRCPRPGARTNGGDWAPYREQRRYLGVAGPAPARDRPAPYRAVAPSLPVRAAEPAAREDGRLLFEGDCDTCGVALCGDDADVVCPVCGASAALGGRRQAL